MSKSGVKEGRTRKGEWEQGSDRRKEMRKR